MPNATILCPTCTRRPDLCDCRYGRAKGVQQRATVVADDQAARGAADAVRASIARGDRAGARISSRAAHAGLAARRTPGATPGADP